MKKLLMAASVILLAGATAVPASAQSWSFGFSSGNGYGSYGDNYGNPYRSYYGNPYRNYYGGYGYGGYYNPYSSYLREYRDHARLHRQLDEAHARAHEEGIYGPDDHADTHDALDAAHERWHENRSGFDDY
jgi:hypothetical protein